jgi:predicted RNase H-like HicB family nuclease
MPVSTARPSVELRIDIDREDDGRWIADVLDLPGVLAYGATESAALAAVKSLALRALADQLDAGELQADSLARIRFIAATT